MTRTVLIATGAQYRKLPLPELSRFEGAGIYYGATFIEGQLCEGDEVVVVWGGNAAGQAAVFLAGSAKRVHILVRSAGLGANMSRYLIRRIEENSAIVLHPRTEIVRLEGGDHLESVIWRDNQNGQTEKNGIRHVFLMTGADPNTTWLGGCLSLDNGGFIKTGSDLSQEDLKEGVWKLIASRTCLKQVFQVFSRRVTYVVEVLNVLLLQWVKDQLRSLLFTKYFKGRMLMTIIISY